jgi:hypothetical protein
MSEDDIVVLKEGLLALFVIAASVIVLISFLVSLVTSPSEESKKSDEERKKKEKPDQAKPKSESPEVTPEIVEESAADAADASNAVAAISTPSILTKQKFFQDISELLERGIKPVDATPVGFWEAFSEGGEEKALERRRAHNMKVVAQADTLIVQRRDVFRHIQEMLIAAGSVQHAEVDLKAQALESRLRLLRLENELKEEQQLAAMKLETARLEQEAAQVRARETINPQKAEPKTEEDPLDAHRRERRARVRAETERLNDFFEELTDMCRQVAANADRAPRIRKLMTIFEVSEEEVPEWARRILENGEGRDGD